MNTKFTLGATSPQIMTLRILLALLFLFSAAAKLYPSPYFAMTTFEVKQLYPMGFNEVTAAYFSRILIGCELSLGILLLQPHYFKRLVLPASFLILLVFTLHLSYEMISGQNEGNCGCFGSLLPMTNLQAAIKNVVAMGLIIWLYKITSKANDKLNFAFLLSIVLASVLFIFLVGPIRKSERAVKYADLEQAVEEPKLPEAHQDLAPVITAKNTRTAIAVTKPDEPAAKKSGFKFLYPNIDKGKKLLCFFAPGCDHCQQTAKQLTELVNENQDFPAIQIVFMDEEPELIPAFFEFAGAKYPYQLLDVGKFWTTLGGNYNTPGVFYLWNGNIIKVYDGTEANAFTAKDLKVLVKKSWSEIKK